MTLKNLERKKFKNILKKQCKFTNNCWEWNGPKKKINNQFYGYFNKYLVHELMWLIKNGSHNSDCFVDHKCKNKLCINPDHLYLNLSSKAKVKRNKSKFKSEFYNPNNWEKPNQPQPLPSKFSEWIFSNEVGSSSNSAPLKLRNSYMKKGQIDHLKIDEIIRKGWMKKEFKNTLNDWKLFYSDSTHNKIFEASRLKVNNSNLKCKPDCILINKKKNQFLIIERKFTYVPVEKILKPKWSSAEGQLWCYSWIDELAKANKVFLVMELYRPLRSNYQKNKYLLPLDQVFIWDRDNRIHHNKCLQMFKRYGGYFN